MEIMEQTEGTGGVQPWEDERETFWQSANIWDIIMGTKEETCPKSVFSNCLW